MIEERQDDDRNGEDETGGRVTVTFQQSKRSLLLRGGTRFRKRRVVESFPSEMIALLLCSIAFHERVS